MSTTDQGKSCLGLDAQRKTVEDYLNGNSSKIVGEHTEVESGGKDDRPEVDCTPTGLELYVSKRQTYTPVICSLSSKRCTDRVGLPMVGSSYLIPPHFHLLYAKYF